MKQPIFWLTNVHIEPKLKLLKYELKIWNKTIFGDINNQVSASAAKLHAIELAISNNGCTEALSQQEWLPKLSLKKKL